MKQGETIAVANGALGLSPRGRPDGQLRLTVANLVDLLPALGLDGRSPQANKPLDNAADRLDRIAPGLGGIARQNAAPALIAGLNFIGQPAEIEGKRAITLAAALQRRGGDARSDPARTDRAAVLIGCRAAIAVLAFRSNRRRSDLPSLSAQPQFPPPVKTSDTLVFICTYNERGSIDAMLDGLLGLRARCDVLVVDDNSTDGTLDVLAARAAAEPRVGVVVRPRKLGIGSAHKLGWLHARRMGYARIATLDADLSHDPADVQRLLDALDAGADVALGSRFVPGAQHDYSGLRLAVSRGANCWRRRCCGCRSPSTPRRCAPRSSPAFRTGWSKRSRATATASSSPAWSGWRGRG